MARLVMIMGCSGVVSLWHRYGSRIRKIGRFSVLLGCTVMVIIQLSECFSKLSSPPVTSFSRVVLNQSMTYPAVTVCHYPPYKAEILKSYNISSIENTSDFKTFPFHNVTLKQFWEKATYNKEEALSIHALNHLPEYVEVRSKFSAKWGCCHTLLPLVQTTASGRFRGYSIMLKELGGEIDPTTVAEEEPGWHVFLHSPVDPWIENAEKSIGTEESIFVSEGEQVHVKVGVQEYHGVSTGQDKCNASYHYSSVQCEYECKSHRLVQEFGCTGPWMADSNAPMCSDYFSTQFIISEFLNSSSCTQPCSSCLRPCHSLQFTPYVMKRYDFKANAGKYSLIYVYYTSRRVEMAEERLAYDWSLFLADLGGSLGFLLGLSVLGIIGIVERLIDMLYMNLQPPWHAPVATSPHKQQNNVLEMAGKLSNGKVESCNEGKILNIHLMETLRCSNKFSRNIYPNKY